MTSYSERNAGSIANSKHIGPYASLRMTTRESLCPILTARFNLGRDQADFIDASRMRYVDHVGHVGEGHVVVTLDEHDLLGARFENVFQAALQRLPSGFVGIDFQSGRIAGTMIDQLHHDGAVGSGR